MVAKIIKSLILSFIFLIGITSASFGSFLSNAVNAEIEINPPVFYLDRYDIIGDGSLSLKMNDNDVNGSYFDLKWEDSNSREFFSQNLGIDNFYSQDFKLILELEGKGLNSTLNETNSLFISLFIAREDGSVKETLCNTLLIGIKEKNIYEAECLVSGGGMNKMRSGDRLKLLLNDGSPMNAFTRVYIGDSKIEVVAK